jgi:hypothetical protein
MQAIYRFSVFAHRRRHRAEAERRQVAVVFTYMVGFTAFSERSGEEAAYTLLQSLAKLMEDAVRDNGGVVRGFTGDGVMVVFGAPVAFEDAPLRACRAALAILERRATLNYQSLLRFDDDSTWWAKTFLAKGINHAGPAGRAPPRRLSSITREGSNVFAEASSMWPRGLQMIRVFPSR